MKNKTKEAYDNCSAVTCGVINPPFNPIESMEKEISILREEITGLKFELLDCYRRLDN